jgi:hypothetical protein
MRRENANLSRRLQAGFKPLQWRVLHKMLFRSQF